MQSHSYSTFPSYNTSSNDTSIETSDYLRSILKPFTGPTSIPDSNMTTSYPKAVELNRNITVAGSGRALFVYLPYSKTAPIRMYIWRNGDSRYHFATDLDYDQDLAEDYTQGRFVSGGMNFISATTSGTLFNVAGTFIASAVQELPDLDVLTYGQISAYKRNNLDVVTSVPVTVGVTALAFPDGDNQFEVFNTNSSFESEATVKVRKDFILGLSSPFAGLNLVPASIWHIFDSNDAPEFFPKNNWGRISTSFTCTIVAANINTVTFPTMNLEMYLDGTNVSTTDWVTEGTVQQVTRSVVTWPYVGGAASPFTFTTTVTGEWNESIPLQRMRIFGVFSDYANQGALNIDNATVEYTHHTYYQQGLNAPAIMVAVSDMSAGQTLTIGGCGNYEVVPNSNLSKNIVTNYFGPFNPLELDLVTHYLAQAHRNGVRFVWETPNYRQWCNSGAVDKHLPMQHIASATGFTDALKSIWRFISPGLKASLPLIGAATYGPGGAMIGEGIGSMIPSESATFGRRNNSRAGVFRGL